MASFQTHMAVGSAISLFLGSILYGAQVVNISESLVLIKTSLMVIDLGLQAERSAGC